jgi:uncharacterized coiled-coil protein SlyX
MDKLKIILKVIWNFINSRIFPFIMIVIVLMFWARSCQKSGDLEREIAFREQNILALNDTITTIVTKSGGLNSSITAHIASEKQLKELNKDLYDKLDDQKGKVLTLNKSVIKLKQDKATLQKYLDELKSDIGEAEQINDSTYQLPWTLRYQYDSLNYDEFSGRTEITALNYHRGGLPTPIIEINHKRTWLESRVTQVDLVFGQRVEGDKLRVFIQSAYPGFTAQSLEGVLIDPNKNPYIKSLIKPKRWFVGFNVGVGTTIGINALTGVPAVAIGPTFNFGIYSFKK